MKVTIKLEDLIERIEDLINRLKEEVQYTKFEMDYYCSQERKGWECDYYRGCIEGLEMAIREINLFKEEIREDYKKGGW